MPVAELRSVTKRLRRGGSAALESIFPFAPGELVALPGPNGAGKHTTAVRVVLLGLSAPTSGEASLFGHHPRASHAAKLRRGALLQVAKVPETLKDPRAYRAFFQLLRGMPLPFAETVAAAGLAGIENRAFRRSLRRPETAGALRPGHLRQPRPPVPRRAHHVGLDVESRRAPLGHIRGFVAPRRQCFVDHALPGRSRRPGASRGRYRNRGRIAAEGTPAEIKAQTHTTGLEDAFLAIMKENGNAIEEVLQ